MNDYAEFTYPDEYEKAFVEVQIEHIAQLLPFFRGRTGFMVVPISGDLIATHVAYRSKRIKVRLCDLLSILKLAYNDMCSHFNERSSFELDIDQWHQKTIFRAYLAVARSIKEECPSVEMPMRMSKRTKYPFKRKAVSK